MKLTLLTKLFTVASFVLLSFVQCTSNTEKLHQELKAEVETINQKCPMMISTTVCLDSCVLLDNNGMKYYYTYGDTIAFDSIRFEQEFVLTVKDLTKNEPGMSVVRDNKLTNEYIYRDTNGGVLYSFKVTPEDYK